MFNKYRRVSISLAYGLFAPFLFISLFGCATGLKGAKPIVQKEIVYEAKEEPRVKYEGSLWEDNGPLSELFVTPKARGVGDIVTVRIVESSIASNKASTNTERDSGFSAGIDAFLGTETRYPTKRHPYFNPFSRVKGDLKSEFEGTGTTERSGKLIAQITARVMSVLPRGNLRIAGSREVTVNHERQFMTLSGIVRPRDISSNNVILSTYISDARIVYSGAGVINDRQRPGWLARVLDTVWPF